MPGWFGVDRCADLSWCRAPCGARRKAEPCSADCCFTWLGLWRFIDKKKRNAAQLRSAKERCLKLHREAAS